MEAGSPDDSSLAAQLVEANEQLVLAALRAQTEAELAERTLLEVARSAELDTLTELPNRTLMLDRMAHAIAMAKRHRGRVALLFLDLNNFKQINDTLGHGVGDEVLKLAARCLATSVRSVDTVSRHGGDEFLVLLDEVSQPSDAVLVAEKMIAALGAPNRVGEHMLQLAVSIGISIYPDDGEDVDTLIAHADAAMYRAKKEGLGSFAFHGDEPAGQWGPPTALESLSPLTPHEEVLAEHERQHVQQREANQQLRTVRDELEVRVAAGTQELEHLSTHDQLTGLANRTLLADRLQHAIASANRHAHRIAIAYVGLDRFKHVNDNFGTALGDEVLRETARRLCAVVREGDTVARMGSDKFVLILDLEHATGSAEAMARLLAGLREPIKLGDRDIIVTSSIGCSLYPADGNTPELLLRRAHAALHRAKEQGRDVVNFFSPGLNSATAERVQLETDLRSAVAQGELLLHYQPQIDLRTGKLVGLEALLRWHHPRRGMIAPDQFIPIAEDSTLIVSIGQWVLREACQQARRWQQAGIEGAAVAVNLAARQFKDKHIVETVREVLQETGLQPSLLELEITESTIMHDIDEVIAVMSEFTALGVMLSIDDFGTGYSSLNYLRRFPVDKLKIDRSFVHDVETAASAAAVARAVILIGHSLGLKVIAEGVETAGQADFLRDNECDEIQGFLIGHPQCSTHVLSAASALM